MNLKKIVKRTIGVTIAGSIVIGGGAGGIYYVRHNNKTAIEVIPVSTLNGADWVDYSGDEGTSGTVVSDVTQKIDVPDDKVIKEVYVKEGDEVKVGDKLLSYDTTLLELDQELQELTVQKIKIELDTAEKDLVKLKNTTPVARSTREEDDSPDDMLYDNPYENDSLLSDDFYDEARMISNDRTMLASSEEAGMLEKQSADQTEEKQPVQTEPVQEETVQVTEAPEAEAAPEQTEQKEVDLEPVQTEAGEEKEAEEKDISLDQEEPVSDTGSTENSEEQKEQILDSDLTEKLGADELGGSEKPADSFELETDRKEESAKLNQSLKPFLTNIRFKEMADGTETLLADTVESSQNMIELNHDLNIIPHFRETAENQFDEKNTYMMDIQGVDLKDKVTGKIYGIAERNGEDYPEIGGYTLIQTGEHVARLTLAFHDGLQEQHEVDAALDDMYVELKLSQEEISQDTLGFVVSQDQSENQYMTVINHLPEDTDVEPEEIEEPDEPVTEPEEETIPEEDVEPEEFPEAEEFPESEDAGTGENEEAEIEQKKETVHFKVRWNHGTNGEMRWPEALKLFFYDNEEEDAKWSVSLSANGVFTADQAAGAEGDSEVAEEETDLSEDEIGEEPEDSDMTQDQSEMIPDNHRIAGDGKEEWKTIDLKWPQDAPIQPGEEVRTWAYAENYLGIVSYNMVTNTYDITMTYQEPVESPLLVFTPISRLTYEIGINTEEERGMRAYKGSGTAEDPYVFLVTDGVYIDSSFVNWVMGFNEDGTIRIGSGYVVKLEIRDTNSIDGAFLRAVELDGTVDMEYGYPPGTYWIFTSANGIEKFQEEVTEPDMDNGGMSGDPGWSDMDGSYTAEELAELIREKELEIRSLKLDVKEAELKLKKYNKEMEESTVVSAINGVVSTSADEMDDAYMVINSSSGLYVKSTVGELDLDSVHVDDVIQCESWESSLQFTAKVTQIDTIPASSSDNDMFFFSASNPNCSNYPVLAIVDGDVDVSEYEYVNVKFRKKETDSRNIFLEKAYVRSENGKSYVYVANENQKLEKRYVKTGKNAYGYVEILGGLNENDCITFPYNKNAREGAATKLSSNYDY